MRFFYIIIVAVFSSLSIFAQNTDLEGRWESAEGNEKVFLTIEKDGSGSFDGIFFTYTIEGNELIATYFYGIFHYIFQLDIPKTKDQPTKLVLKEGNLDQPLLFTKLGKIGKQPMVAMKESDLSLLGSWTDEKHHVTFNDEGAVIVDGKKFKYETKGGSIKMYVGSQMLYAPYSVFQTTLALAFDGEAWQLKRKKE